MVGMLWQDQAEKKLNRRSSSSSSSATPAQQPLPLLAERGCGGAAAQTAADVLAEEGAPIMDTCYIAKPAHQSATCQCYGQDETRDCNTECWAENKGEAMATDYFSKHC